MIECIHSIEHPLVQYLLSDPVRPEIPLAYRVGSESSFALALVDGIRQPRSIVCVRLCSQVPSSVDQLLSSQLGSIAVFYTIWSIQRGSGSELLRLAPSWLRTNRSVSDFYTLSPISDSVRKFHLGLGASIYRQNSDTVNYHYHCT